jgi:hypothetical protein
MTCAVQLRQRLVLAQVMNPEKMRTEYGKLIYMLQDSAEPQISELLEFECVAPVRTVRRMCVPCSDLAL